MILEQKPVQKQKYLNILLDSALAALVIFLMFQVHHSVLAVISPFFYALILAYLINPLVRWLARHKIPRLLAIILVFLLILGILTGLGIAFIPRLASDIAVLVRDIPDTVKFITNFIDDFREGRLAFLPDFVFDFFDIDEELKKIGQLVRDSLDNLYSLLISSTGTLLDIVMTPLIAFYYLKDKDRIIKTIMSPFSSDLRLKIRSISGDIDKVLGGFIRGQLIVALFVGILTGVGCAIIGLPHALTIGLIAGLTNIIPYFGPWIGGIIPVILALMEKPILALWVVILIVIVQQIESNLLSPQIMSHSVGLHPLLVIFSILFFGHLFGIAGMIFGVPLTGSIIIISRYVLEARRHFRSSPFISR